MKVELTEYRSGRKRIAVGDTVKVDKKAAEYHVQRIVANNDNIEVHCFGGKDTDSDPARFRVFLVERCSLVRKPKGRNG